MKKILLGFLMILSLFIIGCDKGKDSGVLGENTLGNSTILANIENKDITLEDMVENEKYGYYDKTNYNQWTFYVKYAKEVIQATENSELFRVGLIFKVTNSEDINELIKYIDNYNENHDKIINISYVDTKDDIVTFVTRKLKK